VVWNNALAACREAGKAISGFELLRRLTQAKRTEKWIWLNEVSATALQQSVRQLSQAFQNFFNSCKGKRKGRKVKPPRFKKKSNQQAATFTAAKNIKQVAMGHRETLNGRGADVRRLRVQTG